MTVLSGNLTLRLSGRYASRRAGLVVLRRSLRLGEQAVFLSLL